MKNHIYTGASLGVYCPHRRRIPSGAEYERERSMNQRQFKAEYCAFTFTVYFYRKGNGGFRGDWA